MKATYWLKFRHFRHGYRAEGSYVEKHTGKKHLFFKTQEEAIKTLTSFASDKGEVSHE